jgi:hypothetical protein
MSVYLKSLKTEKYVKGPEQWTDTPDEARKFGGGADALFYCYQYRLGSMEILGRFKDPKQNFTIPLQQQAFE